MNPAPVPTPPEDEVEKTALAASSPPLAWKISIIVVAHNSGDLLRECITSICRTRPRSEIILVDNASIDGAVDRVQAEFPSVRAVRCDQNLGFGAGNNLGAARAEGEYLVFLNPDTTVSAGWLEALIEPLVADTSAGLVTPKVLLARDPERINVAGLDVHLSGLSMCRGLDAPREALDEGAEVAAISGVAFAMRRDLFEALGGFDESFFMYVEDVDLSLRTWLAGYRCLYVPRAVVRHRYALRVDARKTFWVERGRYLLLIKAFRLRTLLALLPTLLLVEVITWGWVLLREPRAAVEKLRAYGWVLAHRTEIAAKRRRVQVSRVADDADFLARCQWRLDFGQLAGPRLARAAEIVFAPLLRGAAWLLSRVVRP